MPEHAGATHGMAGTQRLGRRTTVFLTEKSIIRELYGATYSVEERHRHRYEVNPTVVPKLSRAGLLFVGMFFGFKFKVNKRLIHPSFKYRGKISYVLWPISILNRHGS
jgi:CTP synthase (UTP-ammonia lyase)